MYLLFLLWLFNHLFFIRGIWYIHHIWNYYF